MVYGWTTTKTENGYRWRVYSFAFGAGQETLAEGLEITRAKAALRAKRTVMPYRRQRDEFTASLTTPSPQR